MRIASAIAVLLFGAFLCWSQPQGGPVGITFNGKQVTSIECFSDWSACHFLAGRLTLDNGINYKPSGAFFDQIECDAGLSCKVENRTLVITGGGGK